MRYDYLVVGAGFAGATVAERLAAAGRRVLVIDRRDHVGGNAHDYHDAAGILVHRYGPHIFHTNSPEVWAYLSRFTTWRPYEHRVRANVGGTLVPVPINDTTLRHFGGDLEAAKAALIAPYTRKQWGCDPADLDPSVLARVPVRAGTDDRYFLDKFQAMPAAGYTALVSAMLDHENITTLLGTPYEHAPYEPLARVVWSGPVDDYFGRRYGPLPYRSARFEHRTLDGGLVQPVAVINYPGHEVGFTRVTEYRHLTGQDAARTTLVREYPTAEGEPLWPVPTPASRALYLRYAALAAGRDDVHFVGRLGTYNYLNIDQAVAQALKLAARLTGQGKEAA